MSVLTKFRSVIGSESGRLLLVGLGIAFLLGALQLNKIEPWGDYAVRAIIGGAFVAGTASGFVRLATDFRRGTLLQTILARPLVTVLMALGWPIAAAWMALVLRYGLASAVEPNVRRNLQTGFFLGWQLCYFVARLYYDQRDEKLRSREPRCQTSS